jgi:hypothetical protein
MEMHDLHNVMLELPSAIVAMLRTGGADAADILGIVSAMLAVLLIDAWPEANNEDRFKMIDLICEEAKTRLSLR